MATIPITVALTIASCSSTTPGDPTSQSNGSRPKSTSTESPPNDTSSDPPSVKNPFDVSSFLQNPCDALTQEQLSSFNITRLGEPTITGGIAEEVGPYCTWLAPEGTGAVTIGFLTNNTGGLKTVYNSRDQFAYFDPTTIENYPAVVADYSDLRKQGECNVIIATSDSTTFRVSEKNQLRRTGACDRAKKIGAAAVATMSEAG